MDRTKGEVSRDYRDDERPYPAARCRGCDCITYYCSVAGGIIKPPLKTKHRKGCRKPLGRLDLITALADYDPRLETRLFGRRLRRYMSDDDVRAAAAELPELVEMGEL